MAALDRQALLDHARRGDLSALGELFQSFRPYVRVIVQGACAARLQGKLDDSDLIQDALLEAHRGFSGFRGATVGELTMWIRQIVLRSIGHQLRSFAGTGKRDLAREERALDLDARADSASSPSEQAIRHEQAARMAEALAQLPEDMQRVLLGRHRDGLGYGALAAQLQRSPEAIRMLHVRALRCLRAHYRGDNDRS
jgi:RNA polymerase sigma-70 factor (ECF subfamily)